jgi:hypothetical protein
MNPNERPPSVRHRKADLHRSVKGQLEFQFTGRGLTSYAGIEVLGRFLQLCRLNRLLRRHLQPVGLPGDFRFVAMIRLILVLVIVGGRRLRHVEFLRGDPMIERFTGLRILPSARTTSRWLKSFRASSVGVLRKVNAEIVAAFVRAEGYRTLTVDVDGTVVSTGMKVGRAFRGYNPHRRKVPSYYPITAHLGETGHILRVQNRPGNVNDGKASIDFLRSLLGQIQSTCRPKALRFRMDGDFFKRDVLKVLEGRGAGYAIKVPFWPWLNMKALILRQKDWTRIDHEVDGFRTSLFLEPWSREVLVTIYRKRVHHESAKNYQLDLFDPNDGYWEYSAVASNLGFAITALWRFMCGRGAHEKVIGELKTGFAFNTVPTNHYGANSAWQQLVAVAHNLLLNFQAAAGAQRRARSRKGTAVYRFRRVRTLRFELFNRAGQLLRPHGTACLRLSANAALEKSVRSMLEALRKPGLVLTH